MNYKFIKTAEVTGKNGIFYKNIFVKDTEYKKSSVFGTALPNTDYYIVFTDAEPLKLKLNQVVDIPDDAWEEIEVTTSEKSGIMYHKMRILK